MDKFSKKRPNKTAGYTIGRRAMEKISAVEGVAFSDEMKCEFEAFDRMGLSHNERERLIVQKYAKKR